MLENIVEKTLAEDDYTHTPNGRYVVAIKGNTVKVPIEEFNAAHVGEYMDKIYREKRISEFGTWVHEGMVWLDTVECTVLKKDAIEKAKKRGELAIYDLEKNEAIFI